MSVDTVLYPVIIALHKKESTMSRLRIADLALVHGVENIRVIMPGRVLHSVLGLMTYTDGEMTTAPVVFTISEERYKVADKYKVTLVPTVPGVAVEHFYQIDLESIVANGHARIVINVASGYEDYFNNAVDSYA
jgi:hypothetical protein